MHLRCAVPSHQHGTVRGGRGGHTGNSKKDHLLVNPFLGCIERDGLATCLDIVAAIRDVAGTWSESARRGKYLHLSARGLREGDTRGEIIASLEGSRHFAIVGVR